MIEKDTMTKTCKNCGHKKELHHEVIAVFENHRTYCKKVPCMCKKFEDNHTHQSDGSNAVGSSPTLGENNHTRQETSIRGSANQGRKTNLPDERSPAEDFDLSEHLVSMMEHHPEGEFLHRSFIKEFIRRLKEFILTPKDKFLQIKTLVSEIDKLAGEKLR